MRTTVWRGTCAAIILTMGGSTGAHGQDPIRASVVKILATVRKPEPYRPWTKGSPQEVSGTGAVIAGHRIITCAHVVSYASQLYVQPFQSADKLPAKVVAVAPGIDLAVLSLEREEFFTDRPALEWSLELPQMKEKVNAYGYPVGGTELSVTEGIISRIEYGGFYYGTQGLHIQVDAALNPGNSGGPAVSDGRMVGIVFSGISSAENIGYLIPVEEVSQFLEDVKDGTYHGRPQIFDNFTQCENDALRAKLGLPAGLGGALVTEPYKKEASYPLKRHDVVTHIGEHAIGSDAKLPVRDDLRLYFEYLVPRLEKDGKVALTVFRDGSSVKLDMPVERHRGSVIDYLWGQYPRYLIHGPLVFSPATQEFLAGLDARGGVFLSYRSSSLLARRFDGVEFPGEELVVVSSRMLPHASTKSYDDPFGCVVDKVNGVKIKNLRHLAEVLRDVKEPFTTFEFTGRGSQLLVFRTEEMRSSTEEILTDNGIRYACSEDLRDVVRAEN